MSVGGWVPQKQAKQLSFRWTPSVLETATAGHWWKVLTAAAPEAEDGEVLRRIVDHFGELCNTLSNQSLYSGVVNQQTCISSIYLLLFDVHLWFLCLCLCRYYVDVVSKV